MTLSRRKSAITVNFSIYKYPALLLCFSVISRSRLMIIPESNCEDLHYTNNKLLPLFISIRNASFLPISKILNVTQLNTHFLCLPGSCSVPGREALS